MTTTDRPLNDIQKHLITRVRQAADAYRAECRTIAADLINSIADALDEGIDRDVLIADFADGLVHGRMSLPKNGDVTFR